MPVNTADEQHQHAAVVETTATPSPSFGRPRVIAVDYDGTLTSGERPADSTLAAIQGLRTTGCATVLATGRIGAELSTSFGDAAEYFDALVLENGAEVVIDGRAMATGLPLDPSLAAALRRRGIDHRRGNVILATSIAAEHAVLDEIDALGMECQLVRNRSELMVLPSGTNKGVGLLAALAELGLSPHDCVAVGDAENDHSLLAAAELGVAVANAIESLKSEADVVLDAPNGDGIVALIDDLCGPARTWSHRRSPTITIGTDPAGEAVDFRAAPSNVIVTGGTGDGKSYLAGLLAEQLIDLHYSVLIVDPEGDHAGLEARRPAVIVGAERPPPPVDTVVGLLQHSDACVIVDLSQQSSDQRADYVRALPAAVEACRRARGRPHWVFFDEAQDCIASAEAADAIDPAAPGYCLATWRPELLPAPLIAAADTVLALTSPTPDRHCVELAAAVAGQPRDVIARLVTRPVGSVLIARRGSPDLPQVAQLGTRRTAHLRHEHKYESIGTPLHRGLWFRNERDELTGAVATNLRELHQELATCDPGVLRHHAPRRDISRWARDVLHDSVLADSIRTMEADVSNDSSDATVNAARHALILLLTQRTRPDANADTASP